MTVLALVLARDEAATIAGTVEAVKAIPDVDDIVVVDDGSTDGTAAVARAAGARVLRSTTNLGKGQAMEGALDRTGPADVYLFVDGDIGASAGGVEPVLRSVLDMDADLAIGVPPAPVAGGFGLVRRSATAAVRRLSGRDVRAPLSGQRAVTRECLWACRPLADGFGVETAMVADAGRMGFRVTEVPVAIEVRGTGRTPSGFRHRAAQGVDITAAVVARLLGVR